jgi:hypothetical protein
VVSLLPFGTLKGVIQECIENPAIPWTNMLYFIKTPNYLVTRKKASTTKHSARLCGAFIYPASQRAEQLVKMVILVVVDTFWKTFIMFQLGTQWCLQGIGTAVVVVNVRDNTYVGGRIDSRLCVGGCSSVRSLEAHLRGGFGTARGR